MMLSTHLLSWLIWLPIVGGFVVLALGPPHDAGEMGSRSP